MCAFVCACARSKSFRRRLPVVLYEPPIIDRFIYLLAYIKLFIGVYLSTLDRVWVLRLLDLRASSQLPVVFLSFDANRPLNMLMERVLVDPVCVRA